MTESSPRRRTGGRAARKAARAEKLDKSVRPVRPGLPGGRYKPLSDHDVARINVAALDALEQIGFAENLLGSAPLVHVVQQIKHSAAEPGA